MLTVAIGVACMAALLIIRRISRKLPGPLIVVVVAIIAFYMLGWAAKGVAVVGAVPPGLPKNTIPWSRVSDIFALLPAPGAYRSRLVPHEIRPLVGRFVAKDGQKVFDANQGIRGPWHGQHRRAVSDGVSGPGAAPLARPSTIRWAGNAVGRSESPPRRITFLLLRRCWRLAPDTAVVVAIIIVALLGLIDIAAFRFLRQAGPADFWLLIIRVRGADRWRFGGIGRRGALADDSALSHCMAARCALLDDVDAAGGTATVGSPTRRL